MRDENVLIAISRRSAARAYELRAHDNSELLHGLLRRFRRTPLDFFVSPRADRAKTEAPARA